jgi:hypothetical protein
MIHSNNEEVRYYLMGAAHRIILETLSGNLDFHGYIKTN